jgi:hypothetical protein
MGGGDDNVGIAVPNNNETISGDGNDNVMDENRNNEGGNDIGNDANVVGKSFDGDNGDGHNLDGIVNSNGGNDSNDVGNPPVIGKAVGERKKKVETGQQSKGGGDDNVGVDVPNHNETYSSDGNDDDLDEKRSNEGGKGVCNINVGKSSDGDNGDGDNSDGIVNNIGGNDSNNVGNQPDSGDAVGERIKEVKTGQQSIGGGDNNVGLDVPYHHQTNSGDGYDNVLDENKNNEGGEDVCDDANNVGTVCDADNGDGDNSDGIVNNIGGNDSNDVVNPPDSGDAFGEVNSLSGTSPSPRSPSKGTTQTTIRWLKLINECDTPVDLQKILLSQVNSVFPIIYCITPDNIDGILNWAPCILKKEFTRPV